MSADEELEQLADAGLLHVQVQGTAHSRRPLSRKLLFIDLFLDEGSLVGQEAVEIAIKASQVRHLLSLLAEQRSSVHSCCCRVVA